MRIDGVNNVVEWDAVAKPWTIAAEAGNGIAVLPEARRSGVGRGWSSRTVSKRSPAMLRMMSKSVRRCAG
jgi:hypothetical protein